MKQIPNCQIVYDKQIYFRYKILLRRGTTTTTTQRVETTSETTTRSSTATSANNISDSEKDATTLSLDSLSVIALDSNSTKTQIKANNTIKPVIPVNTTREDTIIQQNNTKIPNLISSSTLETTEKVPAKTSDIQTESPVSVTSKLPHLFEPRPFSLISRKESTTVQTETTTPAAKVSEHTSSSSGLRQHGFYDDVNSLSSDNSTLQRKKPTHRERSKFLNKNSIRSYSSEEAEDVGKKASTPQIRNPNHIRFTPPTSTEPYRETEEERLNRIRTFRPNVELEVADLSSLTAADISAVNRELPPRGNSGARRGRPRTTASTTTPTTTTVVPSTTAPTRSRLRFRNNEINRRTYVDTTERRNNSTEISEAETSKPVRRNTKIIRRIIRPASVSSTTEAVLSKSNIPLELFASTTRASISTTQAPVSTTQASVSTVAKPSAETTKLLISSTTETPKSTTKTSVVTTTEDTTPESIQTNTVIEETNKVVLVTTTANALESVRATEDNETDNNQEREDILKSPEEGENIRLSESVRQESSVNNGIADPDIKRSRKIIKINRPSNEHASTESGLIIRTRKIIRKLHPTKPPITEESRENEDVIKAVQVEHESETNTNLTSISNSTKTETEEKPRRPTFLLRKKPIRHFGDVTEKAVKTSTATSNEPKIAPFTNRRRYGSKYNVENKEKQNVLSSGPNLRPRFKLRTTTQRTSTTSSRDETNSSNGNKPQIIVTTESAVSTSNIYQDTTTEGSKEKEEVHFITTEASTQEPTTNNLEAETELPEQTTFESVENISTSSSGTETATEFVTTTEQFTYNDSEGATVPFEVSDATHGTTEGDVTTDETTSVASTTAFINSTNENENNTTESTNQPILNNPLYKPVGARVAFNVPKRSRPLESATSERSISRGYFSRKYQRKPSFSPKSTTDASEDGSYKTTTATAPLTPHTTKAQYVRKGYRRKQIETHFENGSDSRNEPDEIKKDQEDESAGNKNEPSGVQNEQRKETDDHKTEQEVESHDDKNEQENKPEKSELEKESGNSSKGTEAVGLRTNDEQIKEVAGGEEEKEATEARYGETNLEKTFKPTENTSLYRNAGVGRYKSNHTTTSRSKPSRYLGAKQRTTTNPTIQDSKEINVEALNLRNRNLFSKSRKMNIPHPGNVRTSSEAIFSSTETPVSPTPESVPETTEQQTTLLHVFAVTESLDEETHKSAEHAESDENNKTLQKLIEINRIVEVHAKEKKTTNKSENIESDTLEAVPVLDKLGVITRVVEIKVVEGNHTVPLENMTSHSERSDRKFEPVNNGNQIDLISSLKNYQSKEEPAKIEIIDSKSHVKTITANPLFNNDASTIALEGLFSHMKNTEYTDAEEDELLNTQNSNLLKVRLLEQDSSSSNRRMKFDYNANFIPLSILKQDEEKAEVIEVPPPQQPDEMIKIAPVSLLKLEMGDASHRKKRKRTTER